MTASNGLARELGERLREARHKAALGRDVVGRRLQIREMAIIRYEMGAARIPSSVLGKMAILYDVDPNWLLGIEPLLTPETVKLVRKPGALTLLKTFAEIQQAHLRRALIALARSMTPHWRWNDEPS